MEPTCRPSALRPAALRPSANSASRPCSLRPCAVDAAALRAAASAARCGGRRAGGGGGGVWREANASHRHRRRQPRRHRQTARRRLPGGGAGDDGAGVLYEPVPGRERRLRAAGGVADAARDRPRARRVGGPRRGERRAGHAHRGVDGRVGAGGGGGRFCGGRAAAGGTVGYRQPRGARVECELVGGGGGVPRPATPRGDARVAARVGVAVRVAQAAAWRGACAGRVVFRPGRQFRSAA
mmetsp:Transcript_23742/g.76095  ORF Transcript_23742/g.76095 Transcript_23742/m.76095 type:complete len:239 (+) Transcript_23742:314-1030(+)